MNYIITHYPNSKEISIEFFKDLNETYVRITNFIGQIYYDEKVEKNKLLIDLTNKQPGVYFIKITINGTTTIEKIILKD